MFWFQETAHRVEQGCLACTVRADQGDYFTGLDMETDGGKSTDRSIESREVMNLKHWAELYAEWNSVSTALVSCYPPLMAVMMRTSSPGWSATERSGTAC